MYGYYSYFFDFTKPTNALDVVRDVVALILCPPSLLSLLCIDCEVGTEAGLVWFSLIALLNAGLYAGIGAIVLRHRKHDTGTYLSTGDNVWSAAGLQEV